MKDGGAAAEGDAEADAAAEAAAEAAAAATVAELMQVRVCGSSVCWVWPVTVSHSPDRSIGSSGIYKLAPQSS